jgi:hypothetical protein
MNFNLLILKGNVIIFGNHFTNFKKYGTAFQVI